jgi:hypothetical protein
MNGKNLSLNEKNEWQSKNYRVKIVHFDADPPNVKRILISGENIRMEMQPSKGLSVGETFFNDKPVFWEAPIGMPDPETLDLWSDEVAINGKPAPGFTFLKTFTGGIELYGLKNWGMPVENQGKLQVLHGETSNIPVDEVKIDETGDTLSISGSFMYKTLQGNKAIPWYSRGNDLVKVTRTITLSVHPGPMITVVDEFENISDSGFFTDWGYHITFRPEKGAKVIIPSKAVEERSGGMLPVDIETWMPASDDRIRSETGIIHRGLLTFTENGEKLNKVLIERPSLGHLLVSFTPAPYMQSWMCNGGAGNKEFTWSANGEPLFNKNWEGIGIETGASALDHNGNTDPAVPVSPPLKPKESAKIIISVKSVSNREAGKFKKEFQEYSKGRI